MTDQSKTTKPNCKYCTNPTWLQILGLIVISGWGGYLIGRYYAGI